jgi:hypothetical protein
VLRQGAEFLKAKEAGLFEGGHIVAEIGEVLAGTECAALFPLLQSGLPAVVDAFGFDSADARIREMR